MQLALRWFYTIKVNLVKVGQTLTKMLFTLSKLFKVFNCSFKILAGNSHYTHISRIMDPINEQCFAFVICILCYMIIRRLDKVNVSLDKGPVVSPSTK